MTNYSLQIIKDEESAIIADIKEIETEIKAHQEKIKYLLTKKSSLGERLLAIANLSGEYKEVYDYVNDTFDDMALGVRNIEKPIENLNFSNRTYTCLREAGFNTVADILNYPFEDFYKVRHINIRILKEIITKMHKIGHLDFGVANLRDEKASIAYLHLEKDDYSYLRCLNINTIGDLLNRSLKDLRHFNLKETTLNHIIRETRKIGYENFPLAEDPYEFLGIEKERGPIEKLDIKDLNLSVRAYNSLIRNGLKTVGDILNYPAEDFCRMRMLGKVSLHEVINTIDAIGYKKFCNTIYNARHYKYI